MNNQLKNKKLKTQQSADYDYVGKYAQDDINGFDEDFLNSFIDIIDPAPGEKILDAMGGDGNLSGRMLRNRPQYSASDLSILEFSRVQLEFAKARLAAKGTTCIWGDILSGQDLARSAPLSSETYDKVVVKSATHEIPLARQPEMYKTIFESLNNTGTFINLGFVFDDEQEREEFTRITHVKDSMAGLKSMVANRHFLTRQEFYGLLTDAGFTDIRSARPFQYVIRSNIASAHYFSQAERDDMEMKLQVAQVQARVLRRRERIRFNGEHSVMYLPGEITIAKKSTAVTKKRPTIAAVKNEPVTNTIYNEYPYDFLRHLDVHKDLLSKVTELIPPQAAVLDLGCALGLLYERVKDSVSTYHGVDISKDFIATCKKRFNNQHADHYFTEGTINEPHGIAGGFDVVTILNVLYQAGVSPLLAIQNAWRALRSGGTLIVSGPTSPKSFALIQDQIEAQLERDGLLQKNKEVVEQIAAANNSLLLATGNYWSIEGMVALLSLLDGAGDIRVSTEIYHGHGYLVAISKN